MGVVTRTMTVSMSGSAVEMDTVSDVALTLYNQDHLMVSLQNFLEDQLQQGLLADFSAEGQRQVPFIGRNDSEQDIYYLTYRINWICMKIARNVKFR